MTQGPVRWRLAIALVAAGGLLPASTVARQAPPAIAEAVRALGVEGLRSLEITGRGSDYVFGQAYDGQSPWPRFNVLRYVLALDYATPGLRDERLRTQGQNPPLGGSNQPMVGQQEQVWAFSGAHAWNVNADGRATPAGLERDLRTAVAARQTQWWLTPHGFVKAAQAAGDLRVRTETAGHRTTTVVAFTTPTGVRLEGRLGDDHLVERIETWVATPVLGDVVLEAAFEGYRDVGGVRVPTRIVHRQAEYPLLDIAVTGVKVNTLAPIEVPAAIRAAQPSTPFVSRPETLADGVWSIPLGPRDRSVLVEFRDFLAVVEAPESEAISEIALAAIRTVAPGKPIRYVVNTHTHFDHSGGLRTYAAEGATIVTHRDNVPYYQQVWSNPRAIAPDRLARSGRTPVFEGVVGSRTLTDGTRRLVIHHYAGNMHHPGMLLVVVPHARLLVEADSFNPPNDPAQAPNAIPNLVHFYDAVERLKLDVDRIAPIHGRLTTLAEARRAIDAFGGGQLWPASRTSPGDLP